MAAGDGLSLADIDWSAPWLAPWRAQGQALAARVQAGLPAWQALNGPGAKALPVAFVPQSALPSGQPYEGFIHDSGQVPTREGLHDFFNGLCWWHFPQAKRQLNRAQADELQRRGAQAPRGPVRDAITVFDENAWLIQAPDALWQALQERRWHAALVQARSAWAQVQMRPFGHAVLEKLVRPYKSITTHLWRVPEGLPLAQWDAWLAQDLQPAKLATKPFVPLPVLGVPGWWAPNAAPDFYDDPQVFRPARPGPEGAINPYDPAELAPGA